MSRKNYKCEDIIFMKNPVAIFIYPHIRVKGCPKIIGTLEHRKVFFQVVRNSVDGAA